MNILMLGDIMGRPGRTAVKERLARLRERFAPDLIVANGENASGGVGLSSRTARELFAAGLDVLTSGNHIWKFKDIYNTLNAEQRLLRPANYPEGTPGRGWNVFEVPCGGDGAVVRVGIINLQGRTYMQPIDCPFKGAEAILAEMDELKQDRPPVILVDFHAEATSEKTALGWFLEGKVSAVAGTHTHIQTSDGRVLPGGTAYITDLGMCGPVDSCLGMKPGPILDRFVTGLPSRFEVAGGNVAVQGIALDVDEATGRARSVETFDLQ